MRPIHVAQLDKVRPVLVLTRDIVRPHLSRVTVAPITTTVRGLGEIQVGAANGLDHDSVVAARQLVTVPAEALGRQLGFLLAAQEAALSEAIQTAFDLW